MTSYWSSLAQRYELLGPPLRPTADNVQFLEDSIEEYAAARAGRGIRALLLGVTPDLVRMRWPEGTSLIAMDNSWPMIQAVWTKQAGARNSAICGDWLGPALRPGCLDVAVGDGSLNVLRSFDQIRRFGEQVASLLREDGRLLVRCYLQSEKQESPDEVFEDLHRGTIASCHALRLRLLMAVSANAERGVAVADAHRHWVNRNHGGWLPAGPGWEQAAVDLIEHYAASETVYSFPTLAELRALLQGSFEEVDLRYGTGPLGDRCPILVLKPAMTCVS